MIERRLIFRDPTKKNIWAKNVPKITIFHEKIQKLKYRPIDENEFGAESLKYFPTGFREAPPQNFEASATLS